MRIDTPATLPPWSGSSFHSDPGPGAISFADLLAPPGLQAAETEEPVKAFAFHALGVFGLGKPFEQEAEAPSAARVCKDVAAMSPAAVRSDDDDSTASAKPVVEEPELGPPPRASARPESTPSSLKPEVDTVHLAVEESATERPAMAQGKATYARIAAVSGDAEPLVSNRGRADSATAPITRAPVAAGLSETADAPASVEPSAPEGPQATGPAPSTRRQTPSRDLRPNPLVLFEDAGQAGLAFQCASLSPNEFQAFRRRAETLLEEHGLALVRLSHNGKTQSKITAHAKGGATWR